MESHLPAQRILLKLRLENERSYKEVSGKRTLCFEVTAFRLNHIHFLCELSTDGSADKGVVSIEARCKYVSLL